MTRLEIVKYRNGIFYSDDVTDEVVQRSINACEEMILKAGVDEKIVQTSPLVDEACILWYKMADSTSPSDMQNHPVMISLICQLRGGNDNA